MNTPLIVTIASLFIFFLLENVYPFFKNRLHKYRHALPNLVLGCGSAIVTGLFLWLFCDFIFPICANKLGLLYKINLARPVEILIVFLVLDFWIYVWHRINHRSKFLWRFHKVHHTDSDMDSTTGVLFHPFELLISMTLRTTIITLLGVRFSLLIIYDLVFIGIVIFQHSNINLAARYDKLLRTLIVTPYMHRLHHSLEYRESNSNFSTVFSFWDRIFRTFTMKSEVSALKLGLPGVAKSTQLNVKQMLLLPFSKD